MNSALAALFGAVGGGARSYGQNTIREEQQAAMEQQRMNELKQQEQARIAQTMAAAKAAADAKLQQRTAGVNSIRALFPDFQAPEGDFDPGVVMNGMQQREISKRAADAQAGQNGRLESTINSRMDMQGRQIDATRDNLNTRLSADAALRQAQIERLQAQTERLGANGQPQQPSRPLPTAFDRQLNEMADVYRQVGAAQEGMTTPAGQQAVGRKNLLTNMVLPASLEGSVKNYFNPEGTAVRARIGNLFSSIGKLRSGGAITDQEFQRLSRFLPQDDEPVQMVNDKLAELQREYQSMIDTRLGTWGQTYRTPDRDALLGNKPMAPAGEAGGRAATDAEAMSALQAAGGDAKKAAAMLRAKGLR